MAGPLYNATSTVVLESGAILKEHSPHLPLHDLCEIEVSIPFLDLQDKSHKPCLSRLSLLASFKAIGMLIQKG